MNLIARAKKALELSAQKHKDSVDEYGSNMSTFYGAKTEHARTAKLVEALLEIFKTASFVDFEEMCRCEKILESALNEMEKK